MASVKNPKTGEIIDIEDDIDVKTGENKALNSAVLEKGYSQVYDVVDPKTKKMFTVDDVKAAQAKGYIEKGEWEGRQDAVERANKGATEGESFSRGLLQGTTFNLADEAAGAGSALLNKVTSLGKSDFGKDYEKTRNESRDLNNQAEAANSGSYLGGQIAGGVATSFVPGVGAIGNVAKGASLGTKIAGGAVGGAVTGALDGFGGAEGGLADQAMATVKGGTIGAVTGAAVPLAVAGGKALVNAPDDFMQGVKRRLIKNDPDAAEFLGKNADNIETVRRYPVDANVMQRSIVTLKEKFPSVFSEISSDLKGLDKDAKKVVDRAYGEFTVIANKADKPVGFDTPTTTDDILSLLDDALASPITGGNPLNAISQTALAEARGSFEKGVKLYSKATQVEDPVTGVMETVAVPLTEGEALLAGKSILATLRAKAFTRVGDRQILDPNLHDLRQLFGKARDTLYANNRGTYPQEALDALKAADNVFSKSETARGGYSSLYKKINGKTRPNADKIQNTLNKVEGESEIADAINRRREAVGQAPKEDFAGVNAIKKDIESISENIADRGSQKIRFDNLDDNRTAGKILSMTPFVGKYIPTSVQNKVRMLNAWDRGAVKSRETMDTFAKKEWIQKIAEDNPIKASWLKRLSEDNKPISRAVVASMAKQTKSSEQEVEEDLRQLGVVIKP